MVSTRDLKENRNGSNIRTNVSYQHKFMNPILIATKLSRENMLQKLWRKVKEVSKVFKLF